MGLPKRLTEMQKRFTQIYEKTFATYKPVRGRVFSENDGHEAF